MPASSLHKRHVRRHGEVKALVETLLGRSRTPASAYDLCRLSSCEQTPLHAAQIYRALNELIAEGKVCRIETLNAFCIGRPERTAVAICEECGEAEQVDLHGLDAALRAAIGKVGFSPTRLIVEGSGLCRKCRPDD